jgi:hypothetical protein
MPPHPGLPLSIQRANADFKAVSQDAMAQERTPEIDVAVSADTHAPSKKLAPGEAADESRSFKSNHF